MLTKYGRETDVYERSPGYRVVFPIGPFPGLSLVSCVHWECHMAFETTLSELPINQHWRGALHSGPHNRKLPQLPLRRLAELYRDDANDYSCNQHQVTDIPRVNTMAKSGDLHEGGCTEESGEEERNGRKLFGGSRPR